MNDARSRAAGEAVLDPIQLEATTVQIQPGLWIGGACAPVPDEVTIVVTLEQTATPVTRASVTEVREPFPDSRWQPIDGVRVDAAIRAAMPGLEGGVLIRCRHGLNRSALIAALVLVARGWTPDEAIEVIRRARPGALSNPYFAHIVRAWPEDPMRVGRDWSC